MTYEYLEIIYDPHREFLDQVNSICKARANTRFHSMAQKLSPIRDLKTGQPKMDMVIIFEIVHPAYFKPEAEA